MSAARLPVLTPERARELLDYDPETGVLAWRTDRNWLARAGDVAGYIDPANGYRRIRIDGRNYLAHRVIFLMQTGRWPNAEIDHISGRRTDNRWANLREADRRGNSRNAARSRRNTSGHTGVRWHKRDNQWQAYIGLDGRTKFLGLFDDLAEAVAARKDAEREYGYHVNHGRAVAA